MLGQQGDQFLNESFIALAGLIEKGFSIAGFRSRAAWNSFLMRSNWFDFTMTFHGEPGFSRESTTVFTVAGEIPMTSAVFFHRQTGKETQLQTTSACLGSRAARALSASSSTRR